MKAILMKGYGPPESLGYEEIDKPLPKKGEALVRIMSTTINDWDWGLVRGLPKIYRLIFGLIRQKNPIPGVEYAGIIESIGEGLEGFEVGDRVYGDVSVYGWGTWSEYACIRSSALRKIPQGMDFVEASAMPHASLLAYQGLVELGKLKPGMKVVVNGGGGGMGVFAVQIINAIGSQAIGVDHGSKLEKMKSLGYRKVIDYTKTDFTEMEEKFDLILDAKTLRLPWKFLKVLKKEGRYVSVGGSPGRMIQILLARLMGKKNIMILPLKPNEGLEEVEKMYQQGLLKPRIDGPYEFASVAEKLRYFGEGHHFGKVVLIP